MCAQTVGIPGDTLEGNVSGIGNYLLEVLRHGGFNGLDPTVYTKSSQSLLPEIDTVRFSPAASPSPLRVGPDAIQQAWWENVTVGRQSKRDNVDLYFAPNYLQPLWYDGRSIIVVHDLIHETCPEYLPRTYTRYMKTLLPRSVSRADRVITVSQSTKRDLIDAYSVSESKIDVAYGAASDRFDHRQIDHSKTQSVIDEYGLDDYILFVGNLEPRKNVHTIVDALEQVDPDIRPDLAIAGQKFQSYPELKEVYESSTVADRVHFLGYVDEAHLPHLYAGAELFVFPSFYEGFGLPLVEAMKTGTPVITSDRASLPEVAGEAGITVDPNSVTQLAEGIERILSSDASHWREQALARAETFTWEETAQTVNDAAIGVLNE